MPGEQSLPGILPVYMKNILFLTSSHMPKEALAACGEACIRLRTHGVEADVKPYAPDLAWDAHMQDTLMLCDLPDAVKELSGRGYAVIALQHEGNAQEKFPGAPYVFAEPEEVDFDSYVKAWQRLRGLPWDILETARLKLRETTPEDLDALYEIYAMPGMTDYMEGLFADPQDERRYLTDYIRNVYGLMGFGVWTVLEKETGKVIGRCGFSVRNGFAHIELGFFIGTKWQRRGYAQEACRAVMTYGRDVLGFETVQALVKEGNDVSRHILERLGFTEKETVNAEEDIYGKHYPQADAEGMHRPAVSPARKGRFVLYLKQLQTDVSGRLP